MVDYASGGVQDNRAKNRAQSCGLLFSLLVSCCCLFSCWSHADDLSRDIVRAVYATESVDDSNKGNKGATRMRHEECSGRSASGVRRAAGLGLCEL